jgi:hypothetical protein
VLLERLLELTDERGDLAVGGFRGGRAAPEPAAGNPRAGPFIHAISILVQTAQATHLTLAMQGGTVEMAERPRAEAMAPLAQVLGLWPRLASASLSVRANTRPCTSGTRLAMPACTRGAQMPQSTRPQAVTRVQ